MFNNLKKSITHRILELIRDSPGCTVKDISSAIGLPPERIRAVLYELKAKGYVEKAGKTYVLTERGLKLLEYLEQSKGIVRPKEEGEEAEAKDAVAVSRVKGEEKATQVQVESRQAESVLQAGGRETLELREVLVQFESRLRELEKKVENLERALRDVEKALESMHVKKKAEALIEEPVMPYTQAVAKLGKTLEKLIKENKVVVVGSLVVDSTFFEWFKAKFPIKVVDVDKLSVYERALLEEMKKEALVILHGGKEYRLVH